MVRSEATEKARTIAAEESAIRLAKAAKTVEDILKKAEEDSWKITDAAAFEAERIRRDAQIDTKEYRAETVELQEEAHRLRAEAVRLRADAVAEGEDIRGTAREDASRHSQEMLSVAVKILRNVKAEAAEARQSSTEAEPRRAEGGEQSRAPEPT
ncbi:hypothetical protein [Streptomyces phaeolivaceus]|uniref:hypothetical protein n=1 Tax=Streptomyces phaeolivaceus TaxID=2653200 RepID=UPI00186A55B0|nr:hypothetical protein [Streptomyces phaeolivaceus]